MKYNQRPKNAANAMNVSDRTTATCAESPTIHPVMTCATATSAMSVCQGSPFTATNANRAFPPPQTMMLSVTAQAVHRTTVKPHSRSQLIHSPPLQSQWINPSLTLRQTLILRVTRSSPSCSQTRAAQLLLPVRFLEHPGTSAHFLVCHSASLVPCRVIVYSSFDLLFYFHAPHLIFLRLASFCFLSQVDVDAGLRTCF